MNAKPIKPVDIVARVIAIDFDGTCVTHDYPRIGRDIGAVPVLQELAQYHQLILWTMRSAAELAEAVAWFAAHDIALWAVNANPQQHTWTASPKCYAHLYIDDAALGIPLCVPVGEPRPAVHWPEVERMLRRQGILPAVRSKATTRAAAVTLTHNAAPAAV